MDDWGPEIFFGEDRRFDSPPTTLMVITFSVMATVLICSSIRANFQFAIPRKLPVLLISIMFGLLVNHIPHLSGLRLPHTGYPPRHLLAFYVPAYCLRSIHMFQKPSFSRYYLVYMVMTFIPVLSGLMHALCIVACFEFRIKFTAALLFASVFSSIQPFFIMSVISGLDRFKLAHSMLQGEALLAVNWSTMTHRSMYLYINRKEKPSVIELLLHIAYGQLGGLVLGYFFAKSMTIPLSYAKFDANSTAGIMLGTMVLAYCTAHVCGIQAYVTCVVIALIANRDIRKTNEDTERRTAGIIEVLYTITDLATYSYCILKITVEVAKDFSFKSMHLYFFNYFAIIITRFISYLMVYPLIKKMLPSFDFGQILVLTSGNVVGNIPLILNVIYLHLRVTHPTAALILPFMLTDALLTTILNNAGMSALMSFIHSNSISAERIASVEQCLDGIAKERENIINTVKMKRYMADVNWQFVRKVTSYKMPHPYPDTQNDKPAVSEVRTATVCCENCPLMPELYGGSRPKKLLRFKRQARKKLIQELKLLAKGHCEKRLISRECLNGVEEILNTDQSDQIGFTIDYEVLKKYFMHNRIITLLTKCYRNVFELRMAKVSVPRVRWRRPFYYLLCNLYFRIFIGIVILMTVIEAILEVFNIHELTEMQEFIYDLTILVIYTFEFVITIIAYSWIYWSEGFQSYFSSHWHILDFISLVITLVTVIKNILLYIMGYKEWQLEHRTVVMLNVISALHILRGLRIFPIISAAFPSILNKLQQDENERLLFGFELAKEVVECLNEIMLLAERFVDNKETRESLLESFKEVRAEIYKLLVDTKIKSPWIATTLETKQYINASKYVMSDALIYLKFSGFADTSEYLEIDKSITKNDVLVRNMMKISSLNRNMQFLNIWWIEHDADMMAFLKQRAVIENIPAGETICHQGYNTKGIYVVLYGFVQLIYEPTSYIIGRLTEDGYLPIVDNISTTRFEEPTQIYIMPGNTFGEMGFLTGRHSDCDIISLTDVTMCIIRPEDLEHCIKAKLDVVEDLECRLWKYATIKLAVAVLISTTSYQSYTIYDIKLKLERSIVPNLTFYSYFVVTEQMEDIILLEGVVVDYFARDVYIAPCYIPRSVLKLEISKHSFINKQEKLQTKLMIIPTEGTDKWSMMELEEKLAEVEQTNRKYMRRGSKKRKKSDYRNASVHVMSQSSVGHKEK